MACPTCDHTMHLVGVTEKCMIYWCPRCGTIKNKWGPGEHEFDKSTPRLVSRVVEFCGTLDEHNEDVIDNLIRLGVTEACTHPDVR